MFEPACDELYNKLGNVTLREYFKAPGGEEAFMKFADKAMMEACHRGEGGEEGTPGSYWFTNRIFVSTVNVEFRFDFRLKFGLVWRVGKVNMTINTMAECTFCCSLY